MMDLLEWGEAARDRGMALAVDAQERKEPDFENIIVGALRRIAMRQATVHSNDLYHEVFENGLVRRPENFNCMGAIWRKCAHPEPGFLIMTDKSRPCNDPLKRAHRSPVYASGVFR